MEYVEWRVLPFCGEFCAGLDGDHCGEVGPKKTLSAKQSRPIEKTAYCMPEMRELNTNLSVMKEMMNKI